jgi:hypothetical protein
MSRGTIQLALVSSALLRGGGKKKGETCNVRRGIKVFTAIGPDKGHFVLSFCLDLFLAASSK